MNAAKHNATSALELSELAQCEAVIARGMSTFIEVGNALLKIRDELLYKEHFSNFDAYCKERWNLSGSHARRLIDSASVVENLKDSPTGELPKSERVARELSKVPKEKQLEVWKQSLELCNGNPTADQVRRVAFPTPLTTHTVPLHPVPSALNSFQVAWAQVRMGPIWKRASKAERKKIIDWMNAQK